MIEIIDKKYVKITGGQNEWDYPKTIITTVDTIASLEFNVTYEDHDYEVHKDYSKTEYYTYTLSCKVLFTNGSVVETIIYRNRLAYKIRSKNNTQNPMSIRSKFDDIIERIQEEFIEAKTSFQSAIRDEAFQLLLTNKLIQNNVT